MEPNTLNAGTLSNMFLSGANRLEYKKEIINELNVFPVPDGDTGTNMSLTIMSAAKEISEFQFDELTSVASNKYYCFCILLT